MVRARFIIALLIMSILMTGCLSGCNLCELGGMFSEKGIDHCYQKLAIAEGNADGCDKIPGTGFVGQNPPRDKCYKLVGEKTNDAGTCGRIQGGMNSYSADECYQNVGAAGGSPDKCASLTGTKEQECRTGVAKGQYSEGKTPSCGTGFRWVAGGVAGSCVADPKQEPAKEPTTTTKTETAGTKPTTPTTGTKTATTTPTTTKETAETKPTTTTPTKTTTTTKTDTAKTDTTKDTKDIPQIPNKDSKNDKPWWEKILDGFSSGTKTVGDTAQTAADKAQSAADKVKDIFTGVDKNKNPTPDQEKGSRLSDAIKDIEDDDMKNAIVKDFLKAKQQHNDMSIADQKKMLDDIKAQHEQNKKLDDLANTIKSNTVDKVTGAINDKIDKAKEQAADAAKDKIKDMATGWIDKNAPPSVKDKLDKAQGAYDKLNDKMEKFGEKVDKAKGYYDQAKKTYDTIKETTDKINNVNDKVANGQITPGRGRTLKGAVILGTSLEHATKHIPVFGDTASTVTKETFGVVVSVGEKKAVRSGKMDDCFSDPANCDTDGISGY